jgi:DnaA regulatory inactivator Hda
MIEQKQITLELGYRKAFGLEDFFVTPSNEEAAYWLENYQNWVNKMLVICGPKGCGKTHMANMFASMIGDDAIIIKASDLSLQDVPDIINRYSFVIVDSSDKDGDEEAMFHLYNMAKEERKYLLFMANNPPARWGIKLADLSSRLSTITAVSIKEPDDVLMSVILVKMFNDRQIKVKKEVIDYILKNIERSFTALVNLVDASDELALSLKKPITVPLVKNVIKSLKIA